VGIPVNHPAILQAIERGLINPADLAERPLSGVTSPTSFVPTTFVPPVPPDATEKQLQAAVMRLAEAHGWLAYHTHNSRHSAKGFPDIVAVRGPQLLFAELKTQTGKFSTEQTEWLTALERVPGILVRRWRPSDWDEIVSTFRGT
jgi:hypothetical protein